MCALLLSDRFRFYPESTLDFFWLLIFNDDIMRKNSFLVKLFHIFFRLPLTLSTIHLLLTDLSTSLTLSVVFQFQITMNLTYAYIHDSDNDFLNGNITWAILNFEYLSHWVHSEDFCELRDECSSVIRFSCLCSEFSLDDE